ncbi:hypothetical protein [Caballeronia sp. BR00000012568055]|uniref:hypothetical protein n=1 Tax=Caballeronia sp. BR00000012568055 TaxID=2918761 RepID=UPI0023F832EA|nr:hypothetical protein [Caballeronia sp. BR00000012568055]
MIESSHALAILALFLTSLTVRVLPALVPLRLSQTSRGLLERVLPLAVFINFTVYIVWTEIQAAPVAAIAAIIVTAIATLSTRLGLVLITLASTAVYVVIQLAIHS